MILGCISWSAEAGNIQAKGEHPLPPRKTVINKLQLPWHSLDTASPKARSFPLLVLGFISFYS